MLLIFDVAITPDALNLDQLPENILKQPKHRFNAIKIKLIQTRDDDSVVYAEAGADFIDLVFSLLTTPLGSIIKAYGQWSPNGCIDNLYRSIAGTGYIKQECQDLLLSPKWAPHFGCSINVLQVKELDARMLHVTNVEYLLLAVMSELSTVRCDRVFGLWLQVHGRRVLTESCRGGAVADGPCDGRR